MLAFKNSVDNGSFAWKIKIVKVTPIFKEGKKEQVTNHRTMPALHCLSKIL